MPNEATLRVSCADAVHDEVRALELLVATDQLDASMLLVGGEEREELEDVHDVRGGEHGCHASLDVGKCALALLVALMPGSPHLGRHVHRPVAIAFSFAGEVDGATDEHLRDALLIFGDVAGAVEPGYRIAYRRLELANDEWESVDKKDQV